MYTMIKEAIRRPIIIIKYSIVGTIGALTNIVAIYLFTDIFNLFYIFSAGAAAFLGYVVAFLLHKYWTFRSYDHNLFVKQAFAFFMVSVMNMIGNMVILIVLVEYVGWWYMASQTIAVITTSIVSFLINRRVTFGDEI